MTLQQFLRNNEGINDGANLPEALLTELYHSIQANEIKMEQREFISSVKEGWLQKQGGRVKTWKKRYIILSGNVLYYFKSPKDKDPIGFIPLENIEVRAAASGATFELHPQAGGTMKSVKTGDKSSAFEKGHHKAFVFRAESAAAMDTWVNSLRQHSVTAALAQSSLGKSAPPVPNPSGSQRDGLAANQS